jgi:hypothetical protein
MFACTSDKADTETTVAEVTSQTDVDPDYPFIGFWKMDCSDQVGIAIDQAGDELYSVTFCGPGGCFKPGDYRPNTTIVGDPAYVIVDENTLDLEGKNTWLRYTRCQNEPNAP